MGIPLPTSESLGSPEARKEIMQNRLDNAQAELQRAIDEGKPEAQIESYRQGVELIRQEMEGLE